MAETQRIGPFDVCIHDDGLWQLFERGEYDGLAIAADWAKDRTSALRAAREMAVRLGASDAPEATKQPGLFGDSAR